MNFAQFFAHIGQHLCSPEDSCVWKSIAVAVEAFATYARQAEDFLYILTLDPEGCGIARLIEDMIIDLDDQDPGPDAEVYPTALRLLIVLGADRS